MSDQPGPDTAGLAAPRCFCRWSQAEDGTWVRDADNPQCPVHYRPCPLCAGKGRIMKGYCGNSTPHGPHPMANGGYCNGSFGG